jgi:hypothetical protein
MRVRVFLYCVFLCVLAGIGLALSRSPIQGVLPTVQRIHKLQENKFWTGTGQ